MNKTWKVILFAASLACAVGVDASGQVIMRDNNGPNLFVSGTQGDDVVFVWEKAGELLVTVNKTTTNITRETGVKASNLHCVGVNLLGGNDTVSYQGLSAISAGTVTNGGKGTNRVFEGRGEHKGSAVAEWNEFVAEPETKKSAPEVPPASGASEQPELRGEFQSQPPPQLPVGREQAAPSRAPTPPWTEGQ